MVRVFRLLSLMLIFPPVLLFVFGLLFWLSATRPDGFYLIEAIQSRSAMSLWISDKPERALSQRPTMNLFAWIRPSRTGNALSAFDEWFQEYLLSTDNTDEAAEGAPYVLPPAIIPQSQIENIFEPYHYDSVTRRVIEDIWNSGFLSVAGIIQPEADVWMKSLLGWHSAGVGLESLATLFGLSFHPDETRIVHPYFLTWLNRQPSAELRKESLGGVTIFESALEVSADELFELHGQLCSVGSLPERLCSEGSFLENPIDPFLRVSRDFRVQLKYFWTVRGGALIWSNQKECMRSAFEQSESRFSGCTDHARSPVRSLFGRRAALSLRRVVTAPQVESVGYFVNERQVMFDFNAVLEFLLNPKKVQSSWLSDLLSQASSLRELRELSKSLKLRSQVSPFWAARLVEHSPGSLELLTVARWMGLEEQLERIHRTWAESQFEFLYSLKAAWSGLPRTPARLNRSEPWQQAAEFKQSKSVFEIGWSEKE